MVVDLGSGVLLEPDLWGDIAQWVLILVGLLAVARVVAFAVVPDITWEYKPRHWRALAWTGWASLILVSVPWALFDLTGDRSAASIAAGNGILAVAVILFVALAVALLRPDVMPLPVRPVWWAALAVLAAACVAASVIGAPTRGYLISATVSAVGVVAFGFGLGTRLQLRVTVRSDGQDDPAKAAFVAARMATMGATRDKASSLKVPQGTDVALPEDAVAALPSQGRAAFAMLRVALSVFSIAPWRAEIVLLPDQTTATVNLRRNGTPAASVIIFRAKLGIDGFPLPPGVDAAVVYRQDLLTAAGAFLLLRLAKAHPVLQDGLCGATDWRGLACQILAGTSPWNESRDTVIQLFATAVDADPENDAAWLGYLASRWSEVANIDAQRQLVLQLERLYGKIKDKKHGYFPLRFRCLNTLTYAQLNCYLDAPDEATKSKASHLVDELSALVDEALRSKDIGRRRLGERARRVVGILRVALGGDTAMIHDLRSPTDYYDAACGLAGRRDAESSALAIDCLELALGLKGLRYEARIDPSFVQLWPSGEYGPRLAALTDRPRIAEIAVFAPHVDKLRAAGIGYPGQFLARDGLEESLDLPKSVVEWMRDICRLAHSCPSPVHAIAWTNLLTREGIDNLAQLAALDDTQQLERLKRHHVNAPPLTEHTIKEWTSGVPNTDPAIDTRDALID